MYPARPRCARPRHADGRCSRDQLPCAPVHAAVGAHPEPALAAGGLLVELQAEERQRLKLAEEESAAAAERERNLASSLPDCTAWETERRALRERAAELDAQLSTRRREHLRLALEQPAPYLTQALGAVPDQPPRARRTWQQAATRIEAYRFDHGITHTRHALGPAPSDQPGRAHWQRAHHDLQRAQRDLGHRNARHHSHEI